MWKSRNKLIHKGISKDKLYVASKVNRRLAEFCSIKDHPLNSQPLQLCPLLEGFLKCNIDASLWRDGCVVSCVTRNHEGFIINFQAWLENFTQPFLAEVLVLKCAIQLASLQKWNHVIFKSNAKFLIDDIIEANTKLRHWLIVEIISQTKMKSSHQSFWFFNAIKRNGNIYMHNLAKQALCIEIKGDFLVHQVPTLVLQDLCGNLCNALFFCFSLQQSLFYFPILLCQCACLVLSFLFYLFPCYMLVYLVIFLQFNESCYLATKKKKAYNIAILIN